MTARCPGRAEQQQPAEEDEGPSEPDQGDDDCTSTLDRVSAMVCTTCGDSLPECLIGACSVRDRCMECTDPLGRVAVNCSIDYESLPIESWTVRRGRHLQRVQRELGLPGRRQRRLSLPGDRVVHDHRGRRRALHRLHLSGWLRHPAPACSTRTNRSRTSWRGDRAPCRGRTHASRQPYEGVECSTCTREDLGATMACRMAQAASCEPFDGDDPLETCFACQLEGGGTATFCDDAGS